MTVDLFKRNDYATCACIIEDGICPHDVQAIVKALDRLTYMTAFVGCAIAHAALNEPKAAQDAISDIRTILRDL